MAAFRESDVIVCEDGGVMGFAAMFDGQIACVVRAQRGTRARRRPCVAQRCAGTRAARTVAPCGGVESERATVL